VHILEGVRNAPKPPFPHITNLHICQTPYLGIKGLAL